MNLSFKNVEMISGIMKKLKKVYDLTSELIFTELGDLALSIEYEYERTDLVQEIFVFKLEPELKRYIQHYYYEWCGENPCNKDICRLVIKLKF